MIDVQLVYDCGPDTGLGHERRMRALGTALRGLGARPHLTPTDAGPGSEPIVVIDSYEVRADDELWLTGGRDPRPAPPTVVAIDDLERDLAVALLVDPNPRCDPDRHRSAGALLHGPRYALVAGRPADLAGRPVGPRVHTVLITMGGADEDGWATTIAAALAASHPHLQLAATRGARAPALPPGVREVQAPEGLFAELAGADLVVTAGGVTLLEALLLGRPVVAVATESNQQRAVAGAADAGAAVALPAGASRKAVARAAGALADDDPARRIDLADTASRYLDGHGADRVAEAVLALT